MCDLFLTLQSYRNYLIRKDFICVSESKSVGVTYLGHLVMKD